MGSITDITDCDGTVLNHYAYDAFGNRTVEEETVENRFGFAGEMMDAVTGQYYLRARFYNPVIARFLSEDTYYGDGLNLYAYCHNNPVGYVDPSGHEGLICSKKYGELKKKEAEGGTLSEKEKRQIYEYEQNQKKSNGAGSDSKTGRNAGEYHTFYEYELDIKDYMKSDSVQFRKANKALIEKMNSDSNFKKQILSAHPEMKQWLDNPNLSNSPTGYTWHHYEQEGILRLVDRSDHSHNFGIYHPTGKGGRDIWGGGKAGRQGKIK